MSKSEFKTFKMNFTCVLVLFLETAVAVAFTINGK